MAIRPKSKVPATPKKKKQKAWTPDTPTRRPKIHEEEADIDLDASRKANVDDLGPYIPEIAVKEFFDKYVPSLTHGLTAAKLCDRLKKNGILTDEGWKDFSNNPKSLDHVHEDVCYSTLEAVVAGIVAQGKSLNPAVGPLTFACIPNEKPESTLRDSTNRPDCAILLRLREDNKAYWDDLAVSGEFKKEDKSAEQTNRNTEQILWDLNQTMRNDPTRRFTFGFTIENTNMRLWHANRSDVVVSQAFGFHVQSEFVVRFFAGIMFASQQLLGWDPTMKRVEVDGIGQFDITVCPKRGAERIYRTVSMISGVKADALRGRASRVWKCIEVSRHGDKIGKAPVVLKDTWIDANRVREGDIIGKLRQVHDPELRETLQKTLLTVECHGDVLVNRRKDRTIVASGGPAFGHFMLKKPKRNEEQKKAKASASRRAVRSVIGGPGKKTREATKFHPKDHYRCVFKEVGISLDEITSLHTVYKVLGEVAEGLDALHKCGVVHRDLTSANILRVDGTTKIADLEYAKEYNSEVQHVVRSGTSYFIPVEIDRGKHAFQPSYEEETGESSASLSLEEPSGFSKFKDFVAKVETIAVKCFVKKPSKPSHFPANVMVYSPLHDLESLWWIGVYFVVNRKVIEARAAQPSGVASYRSQGQEELATKLFYDFDYRILTMTNRDIFRSEITAALHPCLATAGEQLSYLRDKLAKAYTTAEKDIASMDFFEVAKGLHISFHQRFFMVAKAFGEPKDVKVCRYDEEPVSAGIKRKADGKDSQLRPSKVQAV